MKRSRDDSSSTGTANPKPKRSKSIQACNSCRKHKTRCEVLDTSPLNIRCHRCKTLDIGCSYEDMDRSLLLKNTVACSSSESKGTESKDKEHVGELSGQEVFDKWALGSPPPEAEPQKTEYAEHFERPGPGDIWSFLKVSYPEMDWSAPIECIQTMMNSKETGGNEVQIPAEDLSVVLDLESICPVEELLLLFNELYLPWLNISLSPGPLLDLVRCTIAARNYTNISVLHRLQSLTQHRISKVLFMSSSSGTFETIQCLLILALWSPLTPDFADPKLLIASAISIGMSLRLHEASDTSSSLLWLALINTESLLSSGSNLLTNRPTSTSPSFVPHLIPFDAELPPSPQIRMRFISDILAITERGMAIEFKSHREDDMGEWYQKNEKARREFNNIERLVTPLTILPPVGEDTRGSFKGTLLLLHACRLLIVYRAMVSARKYFSKLAKSASPTSSNPNASSSTRKDHTNTSNHSANELHWFRAVKPHNDNVLLAFGKECLRLSELILLTTLQVPCGSSTTVAHSSPAAASYPSPATTSSYDTSRSTNTLSALPDTIFAMIGFAACFLVGTKFLLLEGIQRMLPGSSDGILKLVEAHLRNSVGESQGAGGLGRAHPAIRCANLIQKLVGLWVDRENVIPRFRGRSVGTGDGQDRETTVYPQAGYVNEGGGLHERQMGMGMHGHTQPRSHHQAGGFGQNPGPGQGMWWMQMNDPTFWNGILDGYEYGYGSGYTYT